MVNKLFQRARELRNGQTPSEQLLWERLRNRQLDGIKFRRQHVIGRFVADFYCAEGKLVIELDGGIHRSRNQSGADKARQNWMNEQGLRVIRFDNEVVENSIEQVLEQIHAECRRIGPE